PLECALAAGKAAEVGFADDRFAGPVVELLPERLALVPDREHAAKALARLCAHDMIEEDVPALRVLNIKLPRDPHDFSAGLAHGVSEPIDGWHDRARARQRCRPAFLQKAVLHV